MSGAGGVRGAGSSGGSGARDQRPGLAPARRVLRSSLARSLALIVVLGILAAIVSAGLSPYNDLQLATGAYYFAVLAGLTVLAGQSGQVSLGHGALMAVGAYTVVLLIGDEGWALLPA
ncbi:MAG: hypothetical protein ACRDMJ_09580, partial [Solirubrobacteraceae bacterium]